MEEDLLDWEMVHGSDTESIAWDKKSESSSVIDNGMILAGHLDVYRSDDVGVRNESGFNDFSSVSEISGDDGEVRVSDFEASDEKQREIEAVAELVGGIEDSNKFLPESDVLKEHIEDSSKSWSDSGVVSGEEEIVSDNRVVASTEGTQGSGGNIVNSGDESKCRETVWWKMPFVLLKYSAFRMGPLWSVSIAAAVMGLVLLGRRLFNMKKKAQSFHLKVTIDKKKVMSQAAQLNEVFTEVRRVHVIHSALPSPGTWPPVLSLR